MPACHTPVNFYITQRAILRILSFFALLRQLVAPLCVKFGTEKSNDANRCSSGGVRPVNCRFYEISEYKGPAGTHPFLHDFNKIFRICGPFLGYAGVPEHYEYCQSLYQSAA